MSGAAPKLLTRSIDESDVIAQFEVAMRARGIIPPQHIRADGQLHRCDAEGRGGKGDAAYVLHLDAPPAGGFENHRDGLGWEAWRANLGREVTLAEQAELRVRAEAARAEREADMRRRRVEAQAKARGIWDRAIPVPAEHPYCQRKGIDPDGARVLADRDIMVVPVANVHGVICSLQFIDAQGSKRFLSGGAVTGNFCLIGSISAAGEVVVIAEGFATGCSIRQATGYTVAVAFDCGNLRPVAEAIRQKYPEAQIVIAADDDHLTIGNPGLSKARDAAAAVGGVVAMPEFGPDRPDKASDFNDLARVAGGDEVRRCIETAISGTEGGTVSDFDTQKGEGNQQNESVPLSRPLESGTVGQSSRRKLLALNIVDFLSREIPPREMLLAPVLPTQGLMMLYSWRGIGKTHTAIGIAYAAASAGKFLKWVAPKARRVLYLDGEMPAGVMQERIAAAAEASPTEPPSAEHLRIITPDLQPDGMPNLATAEGREAVEEWLADGCDLLVIDNISTLCRMGKENESESWEPMQTWLLDLRRRGISVLLVHHAGKGGAQRGTSRREDILDTVLSLKRPEDYVPTEGARFEVHFEKSRGLFGDEAAPFEARLEIGPHGVAMWTMREIEDVKLARAQVLFAEGSSVRDVADELGISKSAAGRLKKKLEAGQ